MPIAFTCPSCGRTGRLSDDFKGDKVKCPACQTVAPVPYAMADPPAAEPPARSAPSGESRALRRSAGSDAATAAPAPAPSTAPPLSGEPGATKGLTPAVMGLAAGGAATVVVVIVVGVLAALQMMKRAGEPAGGDRHQVAQAPRRPEPALPPAPAPGVTTPAAPASNADTEPEPGSKPQKDVPVIARVAQTGSTGPAVVTAAAASTDARPGDLVQQIKDATVFIKVRAGAAQASGSGFVLRVDGETVYVATNHHVVNPHLAGSEEEAGAQATRIHPRVTVVFRSGQGKQQEQLYNADVVASQREGNRDLAILKVERVKNPPLPIVLDSTTEPTETMPVLIYGFPFGNIDRMLGATTQGNPAMTINRGSVSSLRRDDAGRVSYIQIDGSVNPGNSGGPVVDEKGRLVGIAVAAISNTTIGFAIPPVELTSMLDGRIGQILLALTGLQQNTANLQIQTRVIDPMSRIKGVEFLYVRDAVDKAKPAPNPDGTWPPLANANRVSLAINGLFATAPLQTTLNGPSGRKMLIQASYADKDGKTIYTAPITYEIPLRPTTLAAASGAPLGTSAARKKLSFTTLGEMVDPAKNCKLTRSDSSVTIDVPAGVHLLSPELDVKNAPVITAGIEGDFVAIVKVSGAMAPGNEPTKYKTKTLPYTFQAAGLVLWQDKNNYLRFERVAQTTKRTKLVLTTEVLVEICKNGKPAGRVVLNVPEGPVYLLLARAGGVPKCMFGPDGRRWVALKSLAVAFPDKVEIGLTASNASREALAAKFENFVLVGGTSDEKAVDEP
jgi:S1-C subfamily serine protease